jgi:Integrase core domain
MTVWRRVPDRAGELTYDDHRHRTRRPLEEPSVESFNGRNRDECLEINDFATLPEARVIIGDWPHAYGSKAEDEFDRVPDDLATPSRS